MIILERESESYVQGGKQLQEDFFSLKQQIVTDKPHYAPE